MRALLLCFFVALLVACSSGKQQPKSKKKAPPNPTDYPGLVARCKVKYAHPMECEALVTIAEGLGLSASDPNSTNLVELREGGWLQVRPTTPPHHRCTETLSPAQMEKPYCLWKGVRCSGVGKQQIVTNLE